MKHATPLENHLARKTAEDYRAQGYHVTFDAPLDFLPGCSADLIARKDDQVRVIAVRTRASLAVSPEMDELARRIDAKPGWSFDLLLVAEPQRLESPEGAQSFERERVLERIEEAETVLNEGHAESAFLLAWSACEAAVRLLIADQDVPSAGITTADYTFEQATYLGVISRDEYRELSNLQKHRNAIVHGYSHEGFADEAVQQVIDIARGMTVATA